MTSAALSSLPMPKARQIVVRVDDELHERLAARLERVRAESGFATLSMSDLVRKLLNDALDAQEASETKRRR